MVRSVLETITSRDLEGPAPPRPVLDTNLPTDHHHVTKRDYLMYSLLPFGPHHREVIFCVLTTTSALNMHEKKLLRLPWRRGEQHQFHPEKSALEVCMQTMGVKTHFILLR